jgi:hypothetical protein
VTISGPALGSVINSLANLVLSPAPPVATRSILAVAHLRLAATSSASISAIERRSPSGVSQERCRSRPSTTTRSPLCSESARWVAVSRQALTRKNDVWPSRQAPSSSTRWVTATRRLDTGVPLLVKRSSGSRFQPVAAATPIPVPAVHSGQPLTLGPTEVTRRVSASGLIGVCYQQVSAGRHLAGQIVTVRLHPTVLQVFFAGQLIRTVPRTSTKEVVQLRAHRPHRPPTQTTTPNHLRPCQPSPGTKPETINRT